MNNNLMKDHYFIVKTFNDAILEYSPTFDQFRLYDSETDMSLYLTVGEVQELFNPRPRYIIIDREPVNGICSDDTLFWSNIDGWGEVSENTTTFTIDEHHAHNLPIGGHWYNIFA